MYEYAHRAADRGLRVIIAGAGGAAHLPGMTASMTSLPVIGVPVPLAAARRARLAAVDRADARRHPGRDGRRRQGAQRRAPRGPHPRRARRRACGRAWTTYRAALDATRAREGRQAQSRLKTGVRFSTNAAMPSAPSAVPDAARSPRPRARGGTRASPRGWCGAGASPPPAPAVGPAASLAASASASAVHLVVGHDLGDEPPVQRFGGRSTRLVSVSSSARRSPTSRGRNQLDEPSGVSPTPV